LVVELTAIPIGCTPTGIAVPTRALVAPSITDTEPFAEPTLSFAT
jgi:hypothetical protein